VGPGATTTTNPSAAYFAWKHFHPREAGDMLAVWGTAWPAGGRAALNESSRMVELVPLLRDLLDALEDGRVELSVRHSDRRPVLAWDNDEAAFRRAPLTAACQHSRSRVWSRRPTPTASRSPDVGQRLTFPANRAA
jgi:hypothetical protein